MSRYAFAARDDDELPVSVGWDPPLQTFFAQVEPPGGVGPEELLLWVGTTDGEITDVVRLAKAVSEWGEIPTAPWRRLEEDQCRTADSGPTRAPAGGGRLEVASAELERR